MNTSAAYPDTHPDPAYPDTDQHLRRPRLKSICYFILGLILLSSLHLINLMQKSVGQPQCCVYASQDVISSYCSITMSHLFAAAKAPLSTKAALIRVMAIVAMVMRVSMVMMVTMMVI